MRTANGQVITLSSDRSWKTAPCLSFAPEAPRISLQLEFEEQYDARQEIAGWASIDFDDAGWQPTTEIGPVGCQPWKILSPRTIPFLTEDPISPTQIKAVELARQCPGYIWSLDLREYTGMMRTGLRTAPPGERGSVTFTEIVAPRACKVLVYQFPDYETLDMRLNGEYVTHTPVIEDRDKPTEFTLNAGPNLFMMRNVDWPALLFATSEQLTFSAERFSAGAAWVVAGPLYDG